MTSVLNTGGVSTAGTQRLSNISTSLHMIYGLLNTTHSGGNHIPVRGPRWELRRPDRATSGACTSMLLWANIRDFARRNVNGQRVTVSDRGRASS